MWGRVDDKLHVHEKPEKAKLEAMGLWVLALSYCSDMLTDGFVGIERVGRLAGSKALGLKLATKLVNVKLWHDADQPCPSGHADCDRYRRAGEEGYRFHDWDHYQPNREAVLAEKARKRKNLEDHRDRKRAVSSAAKNQPATAPETGFTTALQPGRNHGPSPSPSPSPLPGDQPQPQIPEGASAAPPAKPRVDRKRASKRQPDEGVDEWLAALGVPLRSDPEWGREVGKWLDHHRAKDNRFADWAASWRTWKANAERFGNGPRPQPVQRALGYQATEEQKRAAFNAECAAARAAEREANGISPEEIPF